MQQVRVGLQDGLWSEKTLDLFGLDGERRGTLPKLSKIRLARFTLANSNTHALTYTPMSQPTELLLGANIELMIIYVINIILSRPYYTAFLNK